MAMCYTLDKKPAPDYVPCDPNADGVNTHTACCSPGDGCLESGLCLSTKAQDPNNMLWVDACTDRTFKNRKCPTYCLDPDEMPLNKRFFNLVLCPNSTDEWCCSHGTGGTAGLFQGVGTFVRQLPSVTSSSSSSTTTAAQPTTIGESSSATSASPSGSAQPNNTGYVAAISVVSVAFGITLIALLFSLYRLRMLQRSNHAPVQSAAGDSLAPQGLDIGRTYHEMHAKEVPQELHS
ncbi:hypothetical protein GGS26DRAFT_497826 [Hypomontagnella submonticulosa]|nr:hypothetical protein GGS26DRAFT_497826 [Hypomontagnella submonticulosa]